MFNGEFYEDLCNQLGRYFMWHMKSWGTSFQSYAVVPDYWLDGFTSQHSVLTHYNYFIKNQILFLAPENLIEEAAIDRLWVY